MLRGINLIIIIIYGYNFFCQPSDASAGALILISILVILYLTNMYNFLLQYFIHKHYEKARVVGKKTIYIETYQTRLLSILTAIFLIIIGIIHQLGFDSPLQAGGVLGIMGVFLGLTQSSWAPDIISGLIILNSDMFEEGDIVETDCGILGRVYKTKMFHTEILNLSNSHRIMIRNSYLRDKIIHTLSKFASAKGLRECLTFNIAYAVEEQAVKHMLQTAFDTALTQGIAIESNTPAEIKVIETGDHAVTWGILFHVKKVDKI
ncbi:MAG: small-conductance mechanosensitive channel [Lentisphaeria bacterium]|jgi:small-conductance mechanosensitive channel